MTEQTGPETAASSAGTEHTVPRDASHWAAKVDRLQVQARDGVRGTNVAGKRLTGPVQGFGKLWQKTYSVDVGSEVSPQDAIAVWKAHFPEFWPRGNRFAGALTGISPGDVALLDIAVGGGVKMSTGVFVLYADAESFTFATPQGHQFAGWITFSAERSGETTVVQTQVLLRAGDPFYKLGMPVMHRMEDRFWVQTLAASPPPAEPSRWNTEPHLPGSGCDTTWTAGRVRRVFGRGARGHPGDRAVARAPHARSS